MQNLLRVWRFLLASIIAWAVALGMFVLIRGVGAKSVLLWGPNEVELLSLWAFASVLFGTTFLMITLVTQTRVFRSRPYGILILAKAFAMLAAVICYVIARGAVAIAVGDMTLAEAWVECQRLMVHPLMAVFLLYVWLTSVALSFVRQMSAMAGSRVLVNLLLGRYHHPKVETRIFMFLDLEGSTTIAERSGHEVFCRLIQECFRDLTDSAIRRSVEVYQYVGDEAILTWNPARGLQDCNCLRVFFEFKRTLQSRADFYRERFGVLPKFKAGVNLGPATVAEVGVVKRDIAYLSDVLNTAARLESMCREHGAELLITETLKAALPEVDDLRCEPIGELELRGKSKRISVYRVEPR
jgi:adenylate cyclase